MNLILRLQDLNITGGPQDDEIAEGISSISIGCNNGGGGGGGGTGTEV
ncbi:hypothetical protein ACFVWY_20825 [Streptomyces sp. NPDC058195]